MIDNYLLEELTTFAKYGTLAETAQHLNLSQPAITRGTKRIEEELGIKLFERTPNKISLNETGQFAAKKAAQVLAANQAFVDEVKTFDKNQKQVTVASTAPGPLIVLSQLDDANAAVHDQLLTDTDLKQALLNEQFGIIFASEPLKDKKIASSYLGAEYLVANLNEFTPLASQTSVKFSELKGLTFLVLQEIGTWRQIIQEKIPDAKFLYQTNRSDFDEIKNYSIFPYFSTNLSGLDKRWQVKDQVDRTPVPISDPEASMVFYANYLTKNKNRVLPLIEKMQDVWAKVDE